MLKTFKKEKKKSVLWVFLLAFFGMFFLLMLFLGKKTNTKKGDLKILPKEVGESEDLNERQGEILDLLKVKGEITVEELMEKIKDVSERTFRRDMKKLEKMGFLEKEGNTKGSKYIFTE